MKLRRTFWLLGILAATIIAIEAKAQVTIGSPSEPISGALLQLKEDNNSGANSKKGLGMPRVKLTKSANLSDVGTGLDVNEHIGLILYNTNTQETETDRLCPGLHVWDGSKWEPLIPYPVWEPQKELVSSSAGGFTYLDPANTSDPGWALVGEDPANYPLGVLGQYTDSRDNEKYYYTRFYVGYSGETKVYNIKKSYSCDPNNPNYTTVSTETESDGATFEEGVWMNENLRATTMHTTRDNAGETVVTISGPGTGAISEGAYRWGNSPVSGASAAREGLLYTWGAATNGKAVVGDYGPDVTTDEGGLNEGEQIQGICPPGWHLPSDKEWTDLENGIIFKLPLFSNESGITDNPTGPFVGYDDTNHSPSGIPPFGRAMRSTLNSSSDGQSKLPSEGGFYDPNAKYRYYTSMGEPGSGSITSFFWTSSFAPKEATGGPWGSTHYNAWIRQNAGYANGGIARLISSATSIDSLNDLETNFLHSVRCKRNKQ